MGSDTKVAETHSAERPGNVTAIRTGLSANPQTPRQEPTEQQVHDEELEFRLLLMVDRESERILMYRAVLVVQLLLGLLLLREYLLWWL